MGRTMTWEVLDDGSGVKNVIVTTPDENGYRKTIGLAICDISIVDPAVMYAEAEAATRLMAAAPDMLRALKAVGCLDQLVIMGHVGGGCVETPMDLCAVCAIIKKVEG